MNILQAILPWVSIILVAFWLFKWGGLATVGGWMKAIADKFGSTVTVAILAAFAAFVILAISAPKILQWTTGDLGPLSIAMRHGQAEEKIWENMMVTGVDYTSDANPIIAAEAKGLALDQQNENADAKTQLTEREAELACNQLPGDRDVKWVGIDPCEWVNKLKAENLNDFRDEAEKTAKEAGKAIAGVATPVFGALGQPVGTPPRDASNLVKQIYYLPVGLFIFIAVIVMVKKKGG